MARAGAALSDDGDDGDGSSGDGGGGGGGGGDDDVATAGHRVLVVSLEVLI